MTSALSVALVLWCARGASAAEIDHSLAVRRSGDLTLARRTAHGGILRETSARVTAAQVVALPNSPALIAAWIEVDRSGARRPFYALSPDGVRFEAAHPTSNDICLKYARFDPLGGEPAVAPALLAPGAGGLRIIQFISPPTEEARRDLDSAGVRVQAFLPSNSLIVRADAASLAAVASRPDMRWIGAFHPAYKAEPGLLPLTSPDQLVTVNIQVFERGPGQKEIVAARIVAAGGKVDPLIPDGFLLRATLSGALLTEVLRMDEVLYADRWGPTGTDMNRVRIISGADFIETTLGYNGQGVRAEVMDDNVRDTHVDFQSPSILFHGPRSGVTDHGTGCYGIVFGKGIGDPLSRGLLPGAEQGIFGDKDLMTNRYAHTQELVDPNGPYRAVFQSNAWGNPTTNLYTTVSSQMDDILFLNDIVLTNSMANSGGQQVRPEAWAKNIIACGGIIHSNTLTRADDGWFGSTSVGPAADGRIKPDLVHFADEIRCPWDGSDTDYTLGFLGTSTSTAITAGYAGLLMQLWHEQVFAGHGGKATVFLSRPHMTTVKAMLIHSAYQYPFTTTFEDMTRTHQGWGMVDLQNLYSLRTTLYVVDESLPLRPNDTVRSTFTVASGSGPFRATLAFRDPAGNPASSVARINDLSLKVTSPVGDTYWGNNGLQTGVWSVAGGVRNTIDTVENVFIQSPVAGTWTVDVTADEINQDGNPATPLLDAVYSLVVSGGTFHQCLGDWNHDGFITPADVASYINDWSTSLAQGTLGADLNNDNVVTPADIAIFINAWSSALANGC